MDLSFAPVTAASVSLLRRGFSGRTGSLVRLRPGVSRQSSQGVSRTVRTRACLDSDRNLSSSLRGRRVVVTTPLYYVNAAPHVGSAYTTIAADALSRFYRMAGADPVFITGCDEHGEKISAAATAAAGGGNTLSPGEVKSFCDGVATEFSDLWDRLSIQYDRFIRTTDPRHERIVKEFIGRVWDNGDIYQSTYEGLYCVGCEEYKDKKDLLQGEVCPAHQKPCETRKEENYFFALSKYQRKLEVFLENNPSFVLPLERRNEVLGWVKSGLRDFSVSRANNPWGIDVPWDGSQTIYVWFDALLGYISALLEEEDEIDLQTAVSKGWPADVHIIGKDILRFHAVYWPAMLMSAGLPLPRRVIGHGFITKDGMKMGKSLGNTLDPSDLVGRYGSDALRFYFLRAVHFGRDGDFSEQRFVDLVNADLANSLGNLLNRALNLLKKNCDGVVPVASSDLGVEGCVEGEAELRKVATAAARAAYLSYTAMDFEGACGSLMSVSYTANTYIDRVAPWTRFKSKDPADVEMGRRCIVNVLEAVRIVAAGLAPVVPGLSRKIYEALGFESQHAADLMWEDAIVWGQLSKGLVLKKPRPVFPRLETAGKEVAAVP